MRAIGLTDHGVLHGAVQFYHSAREEEIKPLIGCELYLAAEGMALREGRTRRRRTT